ncbi:MAG TPA: tail fiber domain-containing protein [Verrucomicrobiae bacterium]|nr:tail fiber domain-containing protein [Verrucomicrobiae bacterium]
MKKLLTQISLLLLLAATPVWADTPLTFGNVTINGTIGPCWQDVVLYSNFFGVDGTFTLNGVSGTGTVHSSLFEAVSFGGGGSSHLVYTYSLDLSQMSPAANHCLKLIIHFGTPHTCQYDVLVTTNTPSVNLLSASKAPHGDITFRFNSGCLSPGPNTFISFDMLSDQAAKTNYVTLVDDYSDPASGQTNEAIIKVSALVPDIPPNWAYAPPPIPNVFFQGSLVDVGTNQFNTNHPPLNGPYDFTFQMVDAISNGLPVGPPTTQTVSVVNGLFNVPLPFDFVSFCDGSARWFTGGVRPSGLVPAVQFTPLNPPLPMTPAPQAIYAYAAGVVTDITPGQAVTSVNGLKDDLILQGGQGINVTVNGDGRTLTISSAPGVPSDRNRKTGFTPVDPRELLAKLAALPVQAWRYTNEVAGVRHLGPMAQDFREVFGLGDDDRTIATVDEGGVALAAIQGLNQKVEDDRCAVAEKLQERDAEIQKLQGTVAELKELVAKLARPAAPAK